VRREMCDAADRAINDQVSRSAGSSSIGWPRYLPRGMLIIDANKFPKRVPIGPGRVGWVAEEIIARVEAQIASRATGLGEPGSSKKIEDRASKIPPFGTDLARSIGDLQDIVRAVNTKGASLKATEQPIDTSTAAGKAFLDMLGVFAEFETNLRKERQLEGIAKAKAAGVYKGRKPTVDGVRVRALKQEGLARRPSQRHLELGVRPSIGHSASKRATCDLWECPRTCHGARISRTHKVLILRVPRRA
jgi:hypothetical protein